MLQLLAGTGAGESEGSVRFKRHRPEQTLLYRLIEGEVHTSWEKYRQQGQNVTTG